MAIRALLKPVVADGRRRDPQISGPDREDDCPCGSRRRARSCHSCRTGEWLASNPEPLISGERTGKVVSGCYAVAANDCDGPITSEHWLSKGIIKATTIDGTTALISGTPWLGGSQRKIGVGSLGSKVLCERHNSALSPADTTAIVTFESLSRYQNDFAEHRHLDDDGFTLVSGPLFERWLLKLVWGAVASGNLGIGGVAVQSLRTDADQGVLVEFLFRGGSLPDGWGFYAFPHLPDPHGLTGSVGVRSQTGPDGAAWFVQVEFGAIALAFCLGSPDSKEAVHRPSGVLLTTVDGSGEKLIVFAWPETGHPVCSYERRGDAPSVEPPA
jgi:hypothetical protein